MVCYGAVSLGVDRLKRTIGSIMFLPISRRNGRQIL